jgi:hypothetical protein
MLAIIGTLVWFAWPDSAKRHPPGILVPDPPNQNNIRGAPSWNKGGYKITPLAEFQLRARLLSKSRYWLDRESELAPIDFLLGWGPMSDQKVLDELSLRQRGRWYEWRATKLPIPERTIESNCANMHMVGATPEVEKSLKSAHAGDIVWLDGYLISVQAPDGWHWKSSLSRTDRGGGSCELVWVERFRSD